MPRSARSKGIKDKTYLSFIASLPCLVCMRNLFERDYTDWFRAVYLRGAGIWPKRYTEVAHIGPRGLSQKCAYNQTIPLCRQHHRTGRDSHHALGKNFWGHHTLDRSELIAGLNALFQDRMEIAQAVANAVPEEVTQ